MSPDTSAENDENLDYDVTEDMWPFPTERFLHELAPGVLQAQNAWMASIDSLRAPDRKTHELIRMVCTVIARQLGGVERHARLAAEVGATWDELAAAIVLTEPLLETGGERIAAFGASRHGADERFDAVAERRARRHRHAFVGQGGPPDAPSVTGQPDHRVVGDEDVVQEDLVEHGGTREFAQRADVDAAGPHVHDAVRDAGVLGSVRIGPCQADAEVRRLGQRGPHLLAVQHPPALDALGARGE